MDFSGASGFTSPIFFTNPMWVSNEVEPNTVLFFHRKIPSEEEIPSNSETPREMLSGVIYPETRRKRPFQKEKYIGNWKTILSLPYF